MKYTYLLREFEVKHQLVHALHGMNKVTAGQDHLIDPCLLVLKDQRSIDKLQPAWPTM